MGMLERLMRGMFRVLLVGPPGLGKTARVFATARRLGILPGDVDEIRAGRDVIVTRRLSLAERVDFGGCLVPDVGAGLTRALPLDLLDALRRATGRMVLFLDDIGQAPIDVLSSVMLLFDAGILPPNVLIWGATNRPQDCAGVGRSNEALRSRFQFAFQVPSPDQDGTTGLESATSAVMLGTWEQEVASWCDWSMDAGHPAVIPAWHRATKGRTLYQWRPSADPAVRMADYRAWETVAHAWNSGVQDLHAIAGAVGKPVAAEFLAFARLADQIATPDQVTIDPTGAPVPDIASPDGPSSLYLTAGMLAAAATTKNVGPFLTYLDRMPRLYGALLGRDMYRRLGAELSGHAQWVQWYLKNADLFETA